MAGHIRLPIITSRGLTHHHNTINLDRIRRSISIPSRTHLSTITDRLISSLNLDLAFPATARVIYRARRLLVLASYRLHCRTILHRKHRSTHTSVSLVHWPVLAMTGANIIIQLAKQSTVATLSSFSQRTAEHPIIQPVPAPPANASRRTSRSLSAPQAQPRTAKSHASQVAASGSP